MGTMDQYPWNRLTSSDESFDLEGAKQAESMRPKNGPGISRRQLKNLYGLDQSYSQSRRVDRESLSPRHGTSPDGPSQE